MSETIHVAFCSDDNYVGFALISMTSILTYHPNGGIVFHLIHPGLTEESIRRFDKLHAIGDFRLELHPIDVQSFQRACGATSPTFYRFAIPRLCTEADKIIYLDCDLLALRDIDELWRIDLGNHGLGAVGDRAGKKSLAVLGLHLERYFNAGVMVLNLKKMRAQEADSRLCKYYRTKPEQFKFLDQDVLNFMYKDDMVLLPQNWNFIHSVYRNMPVPGMYTVDEVEDAIRHPGIVHFTGAHKPWKMWKTTHHPFAGAFWHFAMKAPIDPAFKRKMWWKRLLTGRFKDAKCERPWNQSMIYQGWREA